MLTRNKDTLDTEIAAEADPDTASGADPILPGAVEEGATDKVTEGEEEKEEEKDAAEKEAENDAAAIADANAAAALAAQQKDRIQKDKEQEDDFQRDQTQGVKENAQKLQQDIQEAESEAKAKPSGFGYLISNKSRTSKRYTLSLNVVNKRC